MELMIIINNFISMKKIMQFYKKYHRIFKTDVFISLVTIVVVFIILFLFF